MSASWDKEKLPSEPRETPTSPPRYRLKIIILAVGIPLLLVAILVALNLYRSNMALTAEKLQAARQRWQEAGCESYDILVDTTGGMRGVYRVQVRNGRIKQASYNEQAFGEELAKAHAWTVPGLFDVLQQDLDWDSRPDAPSTQTEVEFDPDDGHLVRYLRNAPGQHIVIKVEFEKK